MTGQNVFIHFFPCIFSCLKLQCKKRLLEIPECLFIYVCLFIYLDVLDCPLAPPLGQQV